MLPVFANGIVGGEISRLYYMIIAVDFNIIVRYKKTNVHILERESSG